MHSKQQKVVDLLYAGTAEEDSDLDFIVTHFNRTVIPNISDVCDKKRDLQEKGEPGQQEKSRTLRSQGHRKSIMNIRQRWKKSG